MTDFYEADTVTNVIGRLRWLRDQWSDKVWSVVFGHFDLILDGAKTAAKQAFVEHCSDDAVAYHGRASMMPQTPWESIGAYRLRLKKRWTHWSNVSGDPQTIDGVEYGLRAVMRLYTNLTALEIYDIPNDEWDLGGAGLSSDDDNDDNYSRFAVVIPDPHPWARPVVGPDLIVGPETLVSITMTRTERSRIRGAFHDHRPGSHVGIDIYVLFDSTTAADVLADHDVSADYIRMPLGPMGLVGYVHHQMTVGTSMTVGAVHT